MIFYNSFKRFQALAAIGVFTAGAGTVSFGYGGA